MFFAFWKFRLLTFNSLTDLSLKKGCMQSRCWIFEDTSSTMDLSSPRQMSLMSRETWIFLLPPRSVGGTYLVCCYIRTFTCQLKIKFFFTNKTTCSVIVWTFTSSRFCKKLCCCNLFVPKPFSLVGILLIKWAFHPNSWLGWQILQQIIDRILAWSWNAFQCFQSFLL